jgi:hypothetical protein
MKCGAIMPNSAKVDGMIRGKLFTKPPLRHRNSYGVCKMMTDWCFSNSQYEIEMFGTLFYWPDDWPINGEIK